MKNIYIYIIIASDYIVRKSTRPPDNAHREKEMAERVEEIEFPLEEKNVSIYVYIYI